MLSCEDASQDQDRCKAQDSKREPLWMGRAARSPRSGQESDNDRLAQALATRASHVYYGDTSLILLTVQSLIARLA